MERGISVRSRGARLRPALNARRLLLGVWAWFAGVVPAATPDADASDDFRPSVSLIALMAVGFFIPSLVIAPVPQELWIPFTGAAIAAAFVIAGSFFVRHPPLLLAMAFASANSLLVAGLGALYADYYHDIALLYALVVIAHVLVHGLRPALVCVAIGIAAIPLVLDHPSFNWTDPVYSAIYLFGTALLPWTAVRLAGHRLAVMRDQFIRTLETEREAVLILARAAEAKDEVTGDHVARVGELSAGLAARVAVPPSFVDDVRYAAMLHDVGKLHIPDRILLKPGPLTADEWVTIRQHTVWGERILGRSEGFELARRIARSHHENWDGSGYPDGLRGEAIPLAARIVHLADVFDALRNRRPYKPAWAIERCLDEILAQRGRMFDPDLALEFVRLIDQTPDLRRVGQPIHLPGVRRATNRGDEPRRASGVA